MTLQPSFDRITVEPGKMNGQPCIRGLRLTVSFQLAGADHSFDYDLRGSRRAMVQLQKCLVD